MTAGKCAVIDPGVGVPFMSSPSLINLKNMTLKINSIATPCFYHSKDALYGAVRRWLLDEHKSHNRLSMIFVSVLCKITYYLHTTLFSDMNCCFGCLHQTGIGSRRALSLTERKRSITRTAYVFRELSHVQR